MKRSLCFLQLVFNTSVHKPWPPNHSKGFIQPVRQTALHDLMISCSVRCLYQWNKTWRSYAKRAELISASVESEKGELLLYLHHNSLLFCVIFLWANKKSKGDTPYTSGPHCQPLELFLYRTPDLQTKLAAFTSCTTVNNFIVLPEPKRLQLEPLSITFILLHRFCPTFNSCFAQWLCCWSCR